MKCMHSYFSKNLNSTGLDGKTSTFYICDGIFYYLKDYPHVDYTISNEANQTDNYD